MDGWISHLFLWMDGWMVRKSFVLTARLAVSKSWLLSGCLTGWLDVLKERKVIYFDDKISLAGSKTGHWLSVCLSGWLAE